MCTDVFGSKTRHPTTEHSNLYTPGRQLDHKFPHNCHNKTHRKSHRKPNKPHRKPHHKSNKPNKSHRYKHETSTAAIADVASASHHGR